MKAPALLVFSAMPGHFELLDSRTEPEMTLENQTVGATLRFQIRAVNDTGPGKFGEIVSGTVG